MLTSTTGLEKIQHLISSESVPLLCYKYLREKKPLQQNQAMQSHAVTSSKSFIFCKAITRQNLSAALGNKGITV